MDSVRVWHTAVVVHAEAYFHNILLQCDLAAHDDITDQLLTTPITRVELHLYLLLRFAQYLEAEHLGQVILP